MPPKVQDVCFLFVLQPEDFAISLVLETYATEQKREDGKSNSPYRYHWKCVKNFVEKTSAHIYLSVYSDCIIAYLEHEDQCVHRRGSSA